MTNLFENDSEPKKINYNIMTSNPDFKVKILMRRMQGDFS